MDTDSKMKSISENSDYRGDIDGLRAIAILSVLLFHGFPGIFPGGFIGVDIFFVISGYLITGKLINNYINSEFTFLNFYYSRARRILPALILVMAVVFFMGYLAFLPEELAELGKEIWGGALFISNIVIGARNDGYFESASRAKPLLHLWSLGIEEQFYIIWPIIIFCVLRYKRNIYTLLVILIFTSYTLYAIYLNIDHKIAFYLTLNRIWELGIGSLIYVAKDKYKKIESCNFSNVISIVSLILIFFLFFYLNERNLVLLLIPVIATSLLISCNNSYVNKNILSNRILVSIGLISYSLYLWHWPLLSIAYILNGYKNSNELNFYCLVLSIIFSIFSYWLVEKPLRSIKNIKLFYILLIILLLVGYVGYKTEINYGYPLRDGIRQYIDYIKNNDLEPKETRISDGSCLVKLGIKTSSNIICLTNSTEPDTLIIGDSHAMALNSSVYLEKVNLKTLLIAEHGCLPFRSAIFIENNNRKHKCEELFNASLESASKVNSLKNIVIHTRGPFYYTGKGYGIENEEKLGLNIYGNEGDTKGSIAFEKNYDELVSALEKLKKRIIFVIDNPELGQKPQNCYSTRPYSLIKDKISCINRKKDLLEWQYSYRKAIENIKLKNHNIIVYDTFKDFCDEKYCYGKIDKDIMYWDDDHMSVEASRKVLNGIKGLLEK